MIDGAGVRGSTYSNGYIPQRHVVFTALKFIKYNCEHEWLSVANPNNIHPSESSSNCNTGIESLALQIQHRINTSKRDSQVHTQYITLTIASSTQDQKTVLVLRGHGPFPLGRKPWWVRLRLIQIHQKEVLGATHARCMTHCRMQGDASDWSLHTSHSESSVSFTKYSVQKTNAICFHPQHGRLIPRPIIDNCPRWPASGLRLANILFSTLSNRDIRLLKTRFPVDRG